MHTWKKSRKEVADQIRWLRAGAPLQAGKMGLLPGLGIDQEMLRREILRPLMQGKRPFVVSVDPERGEGWDGLAFAIIRSSCHVIAAYYDNVVRSPKDSPVTQKQVERLARMYTDIDAAHALGLTRAQQFRTLCETMGISVTS